MFSFLWYSEGTFFMENLWPAFMQKGGGQRVAPSSAIFQVLSAQNNQYSRAAYFGVICSRILPDQHPRHFSSGDWMLTICIVHIILDLLSHIIGVKEMSFSSSYIWITDADKANITSRPPLQCFQTSVYQNHLESVIKNDYLGAQLPCIFGMCSCLLSWRNFLAPHYEKASSTVI